MFDLYWMQKARCIKSKNDGDDGGGKVTLMNIDKHFKGTCYICGKKGHKKQKCPQKSEKIKEDKISSRVIAVTVVRKG